LVEEVVLEKKMSSRSLNKVMLIGNLTRDPELRYTPQGTPVCTFGLATNRSWVPSSGGERQEETEFHRIVAWQKLAELCSQLLFKGRKVYVEGRLQTRNWTGSDGQERTTTEVVIDNMIILDSRRRAGEEETNMGMVSEAARPQPAQPAIKQTAQVGGKKAKTTASHAAKAVKPKKEEKKKEEAKPKKEEKGVEEVEVKADDIPF
jgi:single-strand DNA-binding protein